MPWTFAHPAAILPLRRYCPSRLNFAALVTGSLAPDLAYYFGRFDIGTFAHSLAGSVLLCLPAGLCMLLLLYLLRKPFWFVLPEPHRALLQPLVFSIPRWNAATLFSAAASVYTGVMTHILWDSFTHRRGWAVEQLPFLKETVLRLGNADVALYTVLQHSSTVIGTAALVFAYASWVRRCRQPRRTSSVGNDRWRYRLAATLIALAVGVAVPLAAQAVQSVNAAPRLGAFAALSAIYATVVFATTFTVCAVLSYAFRRDRASTPRP